jgi:sugar phosphate isomerase/epimerase
MMYGKTRGIWGYGLAWYAPYLSGHEDKLYAKLAFLEKHGLASTGMHLSEAQELSEAKMDELARYLADHDLHLNLHVGYDYLNASDEEMTRNNDIIISALEELTPKLRTIITQTTPHAGHRFDRVLPLEDKLAKLSKALAPIASAAHEIGTPLGIENHADYYCSDMAMLCEQTPRLGIFLDTGNTYTVGEKPVPAFHDAAPYTIGGHFKDHRVRPRPDARPLHFEVGPSAIGDGDVPLQEAYDIVMAEAENPDEINFELEMFIPQGDDPVDAVERSLAFVKSLGE